MRYIVRSVDGAEYGPFSSRELRQLVKEQRLGPGDFVRRETGRTWSPFEQIAGLADLGTAADAESDAGDPSPASDHRAEPTDANRPMRPGTPRPTPIPEPSILDDKPEASAVAALEADPFLAEEPTSIPDVSTPNRELPSVDPVPSTNPFVAAGIPIDLDADEEIQFVIVQSFADASRGSMIGALLGHRGRMICTDRRAATVFPGLGRSSMTLVWLDRAASAGIVSRTSLLRLVAGIILLLYAIYAGVAAVAGGATLNAAFGGGGTPLLIAGLVLAALALLLAIVMLVGSRRRTIVIGTSGEGIAFPCAAAGPWHLARIDEACRERHPSRDDGSTD